jgi:hypothetical protein
MKPEEIRDDRQMRSLTGLSQEQFANLASEFEKDNQAYRQALYDEGLATGMRQRRLGGGRKGKLPRVKDKLFFTLVYFKTYPTFDVLGTQFGMGRSKANENLHSLAPILMNTLVRLGVMPHRQFSCVEEMKTAFQGIDRILIDVTERLYRRSQDDGTQREHYSGKKSIIPSKTP